LLGLFDRFTPKFVKQYANFHEAMQQAFSAYISDVTNRSFPAAQHTVEMDDKEWQAFQKEL
jgi:3-methyl-2-oxobutanoate hydroxymethyltransferase